MQEAIGRSGYIWFLRGWLFNKKEYDPERLGSLLGQAFEGNVSRYLESVNETKQQSFVHPVPASPCPCGKHVALSSSLVESKGVASDLAFTGPFLLIGQTGSRLKPYKHDHSYINGNHLCSP